ncbi:MAG: hypothetical protein ACXWBS_06855 [Chthoniobacterales bacterium]
MPAKKKAKRKTAKVRDLKPVKTAKGGATSMPSDTPVTRGFGNPPGTSSFGNPPG